MTTKEVPYKPGTKSFLVAKRLLEEEDYDTIEREVGVSRKTISNVKSQLKRKGILASGSPSTSRPSSTPPDFPTDSPEGSERELPQGTNPPTTPLSVVPPEHRGEGTIRILSKEIEMVATPIIRKVALNPKILMYYDITKAEMKSELPEEYDVGDFVSDCVEFFMKYGLEGELQWVRRRKVA